MEKFNLKKEELKEQSLNKENETQDYKKFFTETLLKWKNVLSFAALLGLSGVSSEALAQYKNMESIPISKEYFQNLEQKNIKLDSLITVLTDLSENKKEPATKSFATGGFRPDLESFYFSKNNTRFQIYRYELNPEREKESNMIIHGNDIYLDNQRIELVFKKSEYQDGPSYTTHSIVSEYDGDIPVNGCRLDTNYKIIFPSFVNDLNIKLKTHGYKQADLEESLKRLEKAIEEEIENFKK